MQAFTLENDVSTSLLLPVAAAGTVLTLRGAIAPNRNPPAPLDAGRPGVLTLVDRFSSPRYIEIVTYAGRAVAGDGTVTLTGLERGQQGTAARDWIAGTLAYQAATRDQLQGTEFGASLGSSADASAARALLGVGSLTAVGVTAPLTSTGGDAPTLGLPAATGASPGHMTAADKNKLDGIATGATATPLSSDAPAAVGDAAAVGVSGAASRSDHVHAHGNQAGGGLHSAATAGTAGFMSAADKTKLDGVATGAQANVPTNLGIGGSGDARTVTSSTGTAAALPLAGGGTAGLMSQADKTKLDGVAASATNTPLSSAAPAQIGTAAAGSSGNASRADHVHAHGNQLGGSLHALATTVQPGFLSAADKTKLDSLTFAGAVGTLAFHDGTGGLGSSSNLRYRDDLGGLLESKGLLGINNFLDLSVLPTVGGSAALSRYEQFISGGIASWQWTVRSESGLGLIRMRLDSESGGPAISFGSDAFVPLWHEANLDPSTFASVGSATPAPLGSASAGVSTTAARSDHVHAMPNAAQVGAIATTHPINPVTALGGAPSSVSSSSSAGSSTAVARADHQHAHGELSGGIFHAPATTGDAGFMSASDKTKLDGIATSATANASDAALRDRATHTGTQAASTISDFSASSRAQIEAMLVAGSNVTFNVTGSGATRQITISAAGGGGSTSQGPVNAIQASNGSGGFTNSGVAAASGILTADNIRSGEIEGGAYGNTGVRWRPDSMGNPSYGFSEASVLLQPTGAGTAGEVRIEAKNDTGAGLRYMLLAGGAGAPEFFDGSGMRALLHAGNTKTVNGQSLVGSGNISAGLSSFSEGANTASPNNVVPANALTATSAEANVDVALVPKGTGAVLAQVPDNTAVAGNKRGASAVDLQTARWTSAAVASGLESVISGGKDNRASGTHSTVSGGNSNTATATYTTVSGGTSNSATSTSATVGGGFSNAASGSYSWIPGGSRANTRGIYGSGAWSGAQRTSSGDNQHFGMPVQASTTDATATILTGDRGGPSSSNVNVLPNNSLWGGPVWVAARDASGNTATWLFHVLAKRGATAAATSVVNVQTVHSHIEAGLSGVSCQLVANASRGSLEVQVTGLTSVTIDWLGEFFGVQIVR